MVNVVWGEVSPATVLGGGGGQNTHLCPHANTHTHTSTYSLPYSTPNSRACPKQFGELLVKHYKYISKALQPYGICKVQLAGFVKYISALLLFDTVPDNFSIEMSPQVLYNVAGRGPDKINPVLQSRYRV